MHTWGPLEPFRTSRMFKLCHRDTGVKEGETVIYWQGISRKQETWGGQESFPKAIYRPLLWLGNENRGGNCSTVLLGNRNKKNKNKKKTRLTFCSRVKESMHTPLPSWLSKQRAQDAGWIEIDWTKPIAQSMLVALIFIRWLCRRLGSTMGSAICDRCDVRSAKWHFVDHKRWKDSMGKKKRRQ